MGSYKERMPVPTVLKVLFLFQLLSKLEQTASQYTGLLLIPDYQFLSETQCAYKKYSSCTSWRSACDICELEGATLFYPTNNCEEQYVLKLLNITVTYRWVFASITTLPTMQMFQNVPSRPIWELYSSWDPAEIKNKTNDVERPYILLNDFEVVTSIPFLCKKKIKPQQSACNGSVNHEPHKTDLNFGYTYINDTDTFYKIHTDFKTWQNANETCTKENALLFYPKNECENNAVLAHWKATQSFRRMFVGMSSTNNGTFETVDGYPSWEAYNNWSHGGPHNEYGDEGCVALAHDGTLNCIRCGLKLPFMCKKEATNKTSAAVCDEPDNKTVVFRKDYTYIEDTDSVYKIHTIARNWEQAKNVCQSEGSELFFPGNQCEVNTVLNFWKRADLINEIFVGIFSTVKGVFMTLDGRPVWDVYYKFGPGEPNNLNDEEKCLMLDRASATYNDDRCDVKHSFICKKKIGTLLNQSICEISEKVNSSAATFRKDYKYIEDTQSYYKIHTINRDWFNAKEFCAYEGAELFYPETECEADAVRRWWNETQPFTEVFIGVSNTYKEIYETIDGRPLQEVYGKWDAGEPNNKKYKNCVLFKKENGLLRNGRCNDKTSFICKKKTATPSGNATCVNLISRQSGEEGLNYTQLAETKHYYKLYTPPKTYQEAKEICASEKASIFVPENECEHNAVLEFRKSTDSEQSIFIGLSRATPRGDFETPDGRLQYDVYTKWNSLEPNNAGYDEGCASMNSDGGLNDISCSNSFSFICKKLNKMKEDAPCNNKTLDEKSETKLFRKDYKYLEETQSFYKTHSISDSWYDAKRTCALEGATLFYPEGESEIDPVFLFWIDETGSTEFFYVGISALLSKGDFETVDGRSLYDVYNRWGEGEPNNVNNAEDCVILRLDRTLSDDGCNKRFPFMCKKTLASLDWNEDCNNADKEYIYNKDLKKCYKFHDTPKSWEDAYDVCTREWSYLTIINSQAEADFLVKFTDENVRKTNFDGKYLNGSIHIGYHNRDQNGWKSVKGQPLFLTGYDNWGYNKPDGGAFERCGSMLQTGTLNDIGCFQKLFFICEHDVDK